MEVSMTHVIGNINESATVMHPFVFISDDAEIDWAI